MILKDLHSEGIISIKSHEEEYDELSPYHDHINRYGRILNPIRRNRFNNKRSKNDQENDARNDQGNDRETIQETIKETIKEKKEIEKPGNGLL